MNQQEKAFEKLKGLAKEVIPDGQTSIDEYLEPKISVQDIKLFEVNKFVIITWRYDELSYWAPDAMGYTPNLFEAGLYSAEDVKARGAHVVAHIKNVDYTRYTNIAVPYATLLNELSKSYKW